MPVKRRFTKNGKNGRAGGGRWQVGPASATGMGARGCMRIDKAIGNRAPGAGMGARLRQNVLQGALRQGLLPAFRAGPLRDGRPSTRENGWEARVRRGLLSGYAACGACEVCWYRHIPRHCWQINAESLLIAPKARKMPLGVASGQLYVHLQVLAKAGRGGESYFPRPAGLRVPGRCPARQMYRWVRCTRP